MERTRLYLSTIDPNAGAIARANGLGVEIAEFCTAVNADEGFARTNAAVLEQIQDVPRRTLHGAFNELFPCAIDPLARKLAACRYAQALELAQRYGAEKVILHGGYCPGLYFPCWYVEQSVRFWREFLALHPEGAEICLENVMEEAPDTLLSIVSQVNSSRLRLCLDVGHVNRYSAVPVSRWMAEWGGWLSHLHLHNNDGTADSHSALTRGTLPMAEIIQSIPKTATAALELVSIDGNMDWMIKSGLLI